VSHLLSGCSQACPVFVEFCCTKKAHLVRRHLVALLPNLCKESVIDPSLIRAMQMALWTHKVDDGLETRKTVYEIMYTPVRLPEPSNACCFSWFGPFTARRMSR